MSASDWIIEQGVPLAPRGHRGSRNTGATARLREMEVGDSMLVPWPDVQMLLGSLSTASGDRQFTRRAVAGEAGLRVWRMR